MATNKSKGKQVGRRRRTRRRVVRLSEASLFSIVRGMLAMEQQGRTATEVMRLKLMVDRDVFNQPGASMERLGHRLRGLLGALLGQNVVSFAKLKALLEAERAAHAGGSGGSILISAEDIEEAGDWFDPLPDSDDEDQVEQNEDDASSDLRDEGGEAGDLVAGLVGAVGNVIERVT